MDRGLLSDDAAGLRATDALADLGVLRDAVYTFNEQLLGNWVDVNDFAFGAFVLASNDLNGIGLLNLCHV